MTWKKKTGIGCLILLIIVVGAIAAFIFFQPQRPITVDDPGGGGERITLNDRPANFFPANGDGPHAAILMLGGSEGGLTEASNAMARLLQAEGFSVLYPAYYLTSEETRSFNLVPLETFDAALAWLKARDDIDPERIGIIGGSKGAEGALLFASDNPDIRAVVATMPSNVVWQGFDWNSMDMSQFSSSWSRDGKPVDYLPYDIPAWYEWFTGMTVGQMYGQSLDQLPDHPEAAIRVEDIAGPVLLVCGEDDALWPACDMARAMDARAEDNNGPEVEVLAYEDAGHFLYGRPREEDDENYEDMAAMGGSAAGNNAARKDNWPRIVSFFRDQLQEDSAAN
ncbi:MAG: acyl-CoA thioester hydrolase/BAAT C-terminal domain-containing protein [Pseudomonadota bacterium]